MAFWNRKSSDPAEEVAARVKKLERENEHAVKMDHRFGAIGVLTIAIAALIGMAAESVQALLNNHISQSDFIQLVTAFAAVIVMNRGLLAAARNIRRAEGRGEAAKFRDIATMYGVMVIESVSFGYMLWLFEGKPNMLSVQGFLLAARASVLPYATVYLEQQRQQPPDPVDIGIQAEIGQGLGVMGALVEQAYDRTLPTAMKLASYRANATLTPVMDARLGRMTEAAQAYDYYKETGEILLVDKGGEPLLRRAEEAAPASPKPGTILRPFWPQRSRPQEAPTPAPTDGGERSYTQANEAAPAALSARTAPKDGGRERPKKTAKPATKSTIPTPAERQAQVFAHLDNAPDTSARQLAKQFGYSVNTGQQDLRAWRSAREATRAAGAPGPVSERLGNAPPAPDQDALNAQIAEVEARLEAQRQQVRDYAAGHPTATIEDIAKYFGDFPVEMIEEMLQTA